MDLRLNFSIELLTPTQRILLLALPPVLIVALSVSFLIMPLLDERTKLKAEVDRQRDEIASLRQNAVRLPALISRNKLLTNRLLALQMQLPEEKEVSGLLKQVSELGIKSGLQVVLWKPKERSVHASKEVYEIPVEVEMRGTYHHFGEFFSSVTKMSRVVNLANITMKGGDPKSTRDASLLQAGFNAVTYALIPESERRELERKEKEKMDKEKK
ncbi:MAG: type 4a pilus biogenesis protein PilO [Nitrospirales bacterium]|nr:type 4a pilus biogenesis protein PilO [Nitrospirales bacterium]